MLLKLLKCANKILESLYLKILLFIIEKENKTLLSLLIIFSLFNSSLAF